MPKEPEKDGKQTPEPGSPEDVDAKLADVARREQDGGGDPPPGDGSDGGSDSKPKDDGKPEIVEIPKSEHDATAYELRRLRKEKREREEAEAEEKRKAEQEKAKAEGDYEKAVELERTEKVAAQQKTRRMGVKVALSDAAEERGWTASQRKLARRLLDFEKLEFDEDGEPSEESLTKSLDELVAEYPESFAVKSDGEDEPEPGKPRRTRRTPATPNQDGKPFDGYITPEEFVDTPRDVRLTDEFQARVEKSKPFWPDKVPHSSFPGGQGEG